MVIFQNANLDSNGTIDAAVAIVGSFPTGGHISGGRPLLPCRNETAGDGPLASTNNFTTFGDSG